MRALALALALMGVPVDAAVRPPARSAPAANWLATFAATPEGGFRVGNPAARVKIVEYGSFSCPHCRDFRAESDAALKSKYIAAGKVSLEFRPFVLNGPDFVATVLARCGNDPRAFHARMAAFYGEQDAWLRPFIDNGESGQARLQAEPEARRVLVLGQIGGLDNFMARHGMPSATFERCLTDKASIDRLQALQEDANLRTKIEGTPTFFINGARDQGAPTWEAIEPKIVQALR